MKKIIALSLLILMGMLMGCSKEKTALSSDGVRYEKILGLRINQFGNTMVVYRGGTNNYDLVFKKDGTYSKKKWSDKSTVKGIWIVSGNDISMTEDDGTVYTLTANAEGIVKDGMAIYINGESGSVSGLFNEMVGTGTGVLDMGYTLDIGKYKVELTGDAANIVMMFENEKVNIKRTTSSGTLIEDNDYTWISNGYDVMFTLTSTGGATQDITKVDELWWVEGTPINLYFTSDASYVGYMVSNIDFLGD